MLPPNFRLPKERLTIWLQLRIATLNLATTLVS